MDYLDLIIAEFPQFKTDEPIDGADLIEFIAFLIKVEGK